MTKYIVRYVSKDVPGQLDVILQTLRYHQFWIDDWMNSSSGRHCSIFINCRRPTTTELNGQARLFKADPIRDELILKKILEEALKIFHDEGATHRVDVAAEEDSGDKLATPAFTILLKLSFKDEFGILPSISSLLRSNFNIECIYDRPSTRWADFEEPSQKRDSNSGNLGTSLRTMNTRIAPHGIQEIVTFSKKSREVFVHSFKHVPLRLNGKSPDVIYQENLDTFTLYDEAVKFAVIQVQKSLKRIFETNTFKQRHAELQMALRELIILRKNNEYGTSSDFMGKTITKEDYSQLKIHIPKPADSSKYLVPGAYLERDVKVLIYSLSHQLMLLNKLANYELRVCTVTVLINNFEAAPVTLEILNENEDKTPPASYKVKFNWRSHWTSPFLNEKEDWALPNDEDIPEWIKPVNDPNLIYRQIEIERNERMNNS